MIRLELQRDGGTVAEQSFDNWTDKDAESFASAWAEGLLRHAPQGVYQLLIENEHGASARFRRDTRIIPPYWVRA